MCASRIAIEIGSRLWGGAERELARIGAALAGRGHDVRVFCNREQLGPLEAQGLHTELHHLGGDAALHHALRFARALRGSDALLIGTFKKAWLAGLAGRWAGVPRIVARVGLETDVPRNLKYRVALRWLIDGVAVNAAGMRAVFERAGSAHLSVATIHNLHVPAPRGDPSALRSALGLGDAPVVGTVARLVDQKRIDRLIDAVAPLEGVQVVVAGDGPERARLEAAANRAAPGRIHLVGHRDDVGDVLAALDLFVVCSDREGMSNAMIEALGAGVPVVSTPVSGAAEALAPIGDGEAPGVVTPDYDPASVRAAISRLLADARLRAAMAVEARRAAAERFGLERGAAAWERFLVPASGGGCADGS